ncbi:MAG TPA: glycosyltransferase family 2 protein [Thermoanaerobaculia bacterium]|nr:glycosyltransferase family 2 protein [Thermoanaerobaculia bacterium]
MTDDDAIEVSIVAPSLNESLTIGDFVDWCKEGLAAAGVRGEIVIVDSSTDDTAEIALAHGARVLKTPRRGLGRAYIDAVPTLRGKYVIMGDCDCTYDFRHLGPFVERFRAGDEFIMGSRFRGSIERGAMPPLHRYFGTPITTWILNVIYGSRFSDIHCGMRGITLSALQRMKLRSQSWEYASEMVLKSVHMGLQTAEVPIHFLKDRRGRLSHHKRSAWYSPWTAAWINLRAMFVNGANFFLFKPGLVLLALGLALVVPLTFGPVTLGPITLSIYWMLLGLSLSILGLQCVHMGILAKVFFDVRGVESAKWLRIFSYNRSMLVTAVLLLSGVFLAGFLVRDYVAGGLRLAEIQAISSYRAIAGLLLIVASFTNFTFTLVLHAAHATMGRE